MISIHTLELTLSTNSKEFNNLLSRAYKMAKQYKHRVGYSTKHTSTDVRVDDFLAPYGITIEYHNCNYRKMIKFRVNPSEVLGGSDLKLWNPNKENIKVLIKLLDNHISNYFNSYYELNDLVLTRVEFTANLDVGTENVSTYINLMHKIGKVKKFSTKYNKFDYTTGKIKKEHSFDLKGNTNGIEFTVYDKEAELEKNGKWAKAKKAKGILRIEVRLKKRTAVEKALHNFSDKNDMTTKKQIKLVSQKSKDIFLDTFIAIIPYGNFYRLKDAEELVCASNYKKNQKIKMLRLLRLIPEKKSFYLALKELNERNANDIIDWFARLDIAPITISKREKKKFLKNLYCYLKV
ncbi:MAG: hypothetical protein HDR24_02740 [Lachnospiraceae bacterium]|nr:hypothetical protein [Lachnospiraceae bacterium]